MQTGVPQTRGMLLEVLPMLNQIDCIKNSSYGEHLKAVSEQVGVREAPTERPKFHDRDEPRQIKDFPLQVLPIANAAQVKELGSWTPQDMFS